MEKLSYSQARQERRQLKQKLFSIRVALEKDKEIVDEELLKLKEQYEAEGNFTRWEDFPEGWDIGDPYGVKKGTYIFNDVDKNNINRLQEKGYEEIVILKKQPPKKVVVEKGGKKITYTE